MKFITFTISIVFVVTAPMSAFAQMYFPKYQSPPPNCSTLFKKTIFRLASDANAVCRPEVYKARTPRAKAALSRFKRWKNFSQKMWDQEHQKEQRLQNGRRKPPLQPIINYDRAIVFMYSEMAEECLRFNGKLADALIELSHINNTCKDTLSYETFRRTWRDNKQMHSLYEDYSGKNDRNVASQPSGGTHFRPGNSN